MKYLSNTLENQFGLPPGVHADFSRLFRENCDFLRISKGFTTKTGESNGKRPTTEITSSEPPATVTLAEPISGTGKVAFVIMPFVERENAHPEGFFQEVQRSLLTPAALDAGFKVKTANRQGSDLIQSTIINDLLDADLVIADLTEHNPNVLFELGVRIAKDLPTVLVKAVGTGKIFDVDNVIRVYEYNPNLWRTSVEEDLPKLTEFIRGAWESKESDRTYMKILRLSGMNVFFYEVAGIQRSARNLNPHPASRRLAPFSHTDVHIAAESSQEFTEPLDREFFQAASDDG